MKKLYILRHAEAQSADSQTDDKDRALTKKGEASCRQLAEYLKENDMVPEFILCSDSLRTKQTAKTVFGDNSFESSIKTSFTADLYMATPGEIIKKINQLDDSVKSVCVICHNPGAHQLSVLMAGESEIKELEYMSQNFPPLSMSYFKIRGKEWSQVEALSGNLLSFLTPKLLAEK